jgi:hypothetical protein
MDESVSIARHPRIFPDGAKEAKLTVPSSQGFGPLISGFKPRQHWRGS